MNEMNTNLEIGKSGTRNTRNGAKTPAEGLHTIISIFHRQMWLVAGAMALTLLAIAAFVLAFFFKSLVGLIAATLAFCLLGWAVRWSESEMNRKVAAEAETVLQVLQP